MRPATKTTFHTGQPSSTVKRAICGGALAAVAAIITGAGHIKRHAGTRHNLRMLAAIAVIAASSRLACAQTAEITGRVVDSTGAVVSGAQILVKNVETGVLRTLQTSDDGYFTAPLLTRGVYEVTVDQSGFKRATYTALKLDDGQSLRVDFALQLGNVSEQVSVSGGEPLLETENATLSTVIESRQIRDLPTVGRNPLQFALLVPGVRAAGAYGGVPNSAFSGGRAAIAGGPVSTNNYMVDSIAADNFTSGSMQSPLSVDATEEFRLTVRNPAAELGRTGGGIMNLVSKSGTSAFHGDLYEFLQNTIFTANNYFNKRNHVARSPTHFNEWGGTLGGPIKRDKTFFFFNWEQYSQRNQSTIVRTVPTDLERQGDFSQTTTASGALVAIYDPYSTQPDPANPGSYLRTQFPGNKIPAGRISAVAQTISQYFPKPNTTGTGNGTANNFFGTSKTPTDSLTLGVRVDHYITPTRRLAGRYTRNIINLSNLNFFNNIAEPGPSDQVTTRHSGFVSYSDAIGSTKFYDVRAGLNFYMPHRLSRSYGFDLGTLGFPASLQGKTQIPVFPLITNTDVSQLGTTGDHLIQSDKDFAYLGSFTWISGRHTWKFGFENRIYQLNNTQPGMNLSLAFDRGFTQGKNPNSTGATSGFGYASFLLGTSASGTIGYGAFTTETEKNEALYVQDDWKLTATLNASLGLRWEYEGGITDRYNKISNFDPNVVSTVNGLTLRGGLIFPGVNGVSRGHRDAEWTNFQPRLAIAWQFYPKSELRLGYGITYLPTTGLYTGLPSSGYSVTTPLLASTDGGLTPSSSLSDPFPGPAVQPSGSSQGALTLIGQSISGNVRHLSRGYSQQWNVSLQRELPKSWLVELGYMGNRGVRLPLSRNFDYLPEQYLALGTKLQTLVANPFYGTIPSNLALGKATVPQASLLFTYPQFSAVTGYAAGADSIYHAGTIRVEKRYARSLGLLLSYTFSKLIDDNSGNGGNNFNETGSEAVRYWGDISLERSVSTENLPHRLVISGSYALPFNHFGNSLVRQAIGGWQLNAIGTVESGKSIGVTQNAATYGSSIPNLIGNASLGHPTINMWLNRAAFADAPAFTFGNAPRNLPSTRTQAFGNLDLSIMKDFGIRGDRRLQFRAEAFNFTNSAILGGPNTNIDSSTFGTVTSLAANNNPRTIQFALKFYF